MPKRATSTSFKPGQSGNPKGAPKKEWTLTQTMRELLDEVDPDTKKTKRQMLIEATWQHAMKGDATANKLLFNYIEGMPKQQVDVTSGGEKITPILGSLEVHSEASE